MEVGSLTPLFTRVFFTSQIFSRISEASTVAVADGILTLSKCSIEPKKDGFQKVPPIPGCYFQVSHEKKTPYFLLNPGWLIGILTMVYYNPYITG